MDLTGDNEEEEEEEQLSVVTRPPPIPRAGNPRIVRIGGKRVAIVPVSKSEMTRLKNSTASPTPSRSAATSHRNQFTKTKSTIDSSLISEEEMGREDAA